MARIHFKAAAPSALLSSEAGTSALHARLPARLCNLVVSWPKQATWEDLTPWPAEASMLSRAAQAPFSPFLDSRNELEVRPEHGGHQKTLTFSFFYFSVFSE